MSDASSSKTISQQDYVIPHVLEASLKLPTVTYKIIQLQHEMATRYDVNRAQIQPSSGSSALTGRVWCILPLIVFFHCCSLVDFAFSNHFFLANIPYFILEHPLNISSVTLLESFHHLVIFLFHCTLTKDSKTPSLSSNSDTQTFIQLRPFA
jgi:hypothetical protein